MTRFDFSTATEIVFGRGRIAELGRRARAFGARALFVTGARPERSLFVLELLRDAGLACERFAVSGEPTTEVARVGVEAVRASGAELVIALGGGSVLDAGKAIAALAANGGDPLEYLEVVGRGREIRNASLPFIAVPTTSGTGSEVTKNAVLQAEEQRVKVSLRSPLMLPRLALVDSELTHSVPPDVTAATGLDALTQVMEPYVSKARGPLTDALCVEGMRRARRSLLRAFRDGNDAEARDDLALTSLFGGLALANAKLGAVHGFAGPLGGAFSAPHGAICARLLPEVMAVNLRVARESGQDRIVDRYGTIARILMQCESALPEDGASFVAELVEALRIPRLAGYGVTSVHLEELVQNASVSSSMKGNPVELAPTELRGILERCL